VSLEKNLMADGSAHSLCNNFMVFTSVDVTAVLIHSRNEEIKQSLLTYCEISREYFIRFCLLSKLFTVARMR